MLKKGHKTGVEGRPKDFEQRTILATECLLEYKFTIPTIIDYMDGKVNADYAAAPVRTTITDLDGNVVYYAGPGPFDFRIPKIEKAIKRVIAGGGYMPAVPPVQWGKPDDGLRCGLSIDPADPTVGDEITVRLAFENAGDTDCDIYYEGSAAVKNIAVKDSQGQKLVIEPVVDNSSWARRFRGRETGWKNIAAGTSKEFIIEAKIVNAADSEKAEAGKYGGKLSWNVSQDTLSNIDGDLPGAVWLGSIASGVCDLDVSLVRQESCMDCHSKNDYHHKSNKECSMCHVGKMGAKDFDVKKDACSCCHKREGKFGRRKIFGAGGDFDHASKHISGMIKDSDCLQCHDTSKDSDGVVRLVGADTGDGSRTAFCLRCHEDKSSFIKSTHGKNVGDDGCSNCHYSHGSENRALLKAAYASSGDEADGDIAKGYALCWTCHDQQQVMKKNKGFGKLHREHVIKKNTPCGACHNVHGAHDADEPGMIDFDPGISAGSGVKYIDGKDASAAFAIEEGGGKGACYLQCHKKHKPKKYSR